MRPHRRYSEEEKKVLLATVARAQEQSAQPLRWILAELVCLFAVGVATFVFTAV